MYFNSEESRQNHTQANKNRNVRKSNILIYNKNPSVCMECEKPLPYDKRSNKFCNRSCSASNTNRGSRKHGRAPIDCLWCGCKVKNGDNKFCSKDCFHIYKYHTFINRWMLDVEDGMRGKDGISDTIRRYLFEKYNSSCQRCGWGQINIYTSKVPLTIHHIDGNHRNNKEYNLELLCPNCHSLTDNYGSRNNSLREGRNKLRVTKG